MAAGKTSSPALAMCCGWSMAALGNVPVRPDNGLGGFTVAAENPVYVMGNYNSNAGDPFWANPNRRG